MTFRRTLPVLLLAALLLVPASASAKSRYRVGIGERNVAMFFDDAFQPLKLERVRYIVPWDWQRHQFQVDEISTFMDAAENAGMEVFVHFEASRGCWDDGRYSRRKSCRAPSQKAYRKSFNAFREQFPQVKVYGAWNEINHESQPTYKSPKRAARYYNTMRKACRRCTIVAADLLDSSNLERYTKKFKRHVKGTPKIWGLHNYSDVNRKRSRYTKKFLKLVPGQVWLTETGGLVKFERNFPYSLKRAKSRTAYMFDLADRFSRKRRGYKSRITRIYPYKWRGEERGARFDAGLVGPTGEPRPAYGTFRAKLRTRSK